jgi:hypothetical protein
MLAQPLLRKDGWEMIRPTLVHLLGLAHRRGYCPAFAAFIVTYRRLVIDG